MEAHVLRLIRQEIAGQQLLAAQAMGNGVEGVEWPSIFTADEALRAWLTDDAPAVEAETLTPAELAVRKALGVGLAA